MSKVLGPSIMKERSAFNLKKTIMSYNVLQIVFCTYIFYEGCVSGWLSGYNWLCQDIDRDTDPNSKGNYTANVLSLDIANVCLGSHSKDGL